MFPWLEVIQSSPDAKWIKTWRLVCSDKVMIKSSPDAKGIKTQWGQSLHWMKPIQSSPDAKGIKTEKPKYFLIFEMLGRDKTCQAEPIDFRNFGVVD